MSFMKKISFSASVVVLSVLLPAFAFAADQAAEANKSNANGWYAIAAAFAIGIAALGGTLSQGKAASAALEGISRNPGAADRIFTPMILGLALIESLVLFALVIAYLIQSNIVK